MLNEEILLKRNDQLSLRVKITFYIISILIPFSIIFFLSEYDFWIKLLPIIIILILDRTLLDLPFEFSQLSYMFLFNPVKSIKGIFRLFKPKAEELINYPILKPIFYFAIISYSVYRFSILLIIIFYLYIIIKLII